MGWWGRGRRRSGHDDAWGLADALKSLRAELTEATAAGADAGLRFTVEQIDLELAVDVRREAGGDGGFKFWVVSLQGRGQQARQTTHRISLTLGLAGDPLISGAEDRIPDE
ncbi:trypco2 family protein [Streptomyces sp. NPDC048290]|uniref:trypco2 family protein n=1 Tax=Streptomyces sp. NPDC048290 TaxID=3155811 RepID=UPI00341C2938